MKKNNKDPMRQWFEDMERIQKLRDIMERVFSKNNKLNIQKHKQQ